MDINNILGKIDAYKAAKDKAAEEQKAEEVREMQQLEAQIRLLKPNIENVIKVYRYSVKNGIPFKCTYSTNPDVDKVHSAGDFIADAVVTRLGFVPRHQNYIEDYLCIKGSGVYDFITDGDYIANRDFAGGVDTSPSLRLLRRFVNEFPIFESDFYAYIEKKTEIKLSKKGETLLC